MLKPKAIIVFLIILSFVLNCSKADVKQKNDTAKIKVVPGQNDSTKTNTKYKVKFVELGSVSCIPCKMMMPVMETIEKDFGDQVEVIFHDVWKDTIPAQKYGIRLIPTQVFLDETGKEFFRHEGFFAQAEIEKLLLDRGLTKISKTNSDTK